MDRVAFVTICWFIFWTTVGYYLGRWLDIHITLTITGFVFAALTTFAWPWIFPESFEDWMHD